jgi:hypothetical protein
MYSSRVIHTNNFLSEKLFPIWKIRFIPDAVLEKPEIMPSPTFDEINTFLTQIFAAADLKAEVGIIMLIYLERMLYRSRITLHGINCFRAILGALIVASKVWEDNGVWNQDFQSIMPDLQIKDLNQLERWWLATVGFDVSVKRTVFARYWFELREVIERQYGGPIEQMRQARKASLAGSGEEQDPLLASNLSMMKSMDLNAQSPSIVGTAPSQMELCLMKPITEDRLHRLSATTAYSQSKLRDSFSEALSSRSKVNLSEPRAGDRKNIDSKLLVPKPVYRRVDSIQQTVQSSKAPSFVASEEVLADHKALQETVATKLNSELNDFGWGGSNLRRSKSDYFYTPSLPPASVL